MTAEPASELHFMPDSAELARAVARSAGWGAHEVDVHRFPDGEHRVRIEPTAAGTVVLCAQLHDPDGRLFPLLLAIDALRRSGVATIRLLVPYLPYMRQDVAFHAGEAVSQQVIAQLLGGAVDEIVTLEPHLHRIGGLESVFPCRARALSSAQLLADWCRAGAQPAFLVGPDAESEAWVRSLADAAQLPYLVCRKQRRGDADVSVTLPEHSHPGRAIIVDDIASSGGTLASAALALRSAGTPAVAAAIVHAVFAPGALERIRVAGIVELVSTDSVPHATNAISTAEFFASALTADAAATASEADTCSA